MATYTLLTVIFATSLLVATGVRVRQWRAWWLTAILLLALTIVFDSIIVRLGIVGYNDAKRLGINLGYAPIEDYLYTILAVFLVPSLWYIFERKTSVKVVAKNLLITVKKLLLVSRPVSWLNTSYPFAVGYLVAGGQVDTRFVVGTLYFLIPYNLLMYGINDVFDYESDIKNPRKGGIEGMREQRAFHPVIVRAAVASNLPLLAYLYNAGGRLAALWLSVVTFLVLAYSVPYLRFKERAFLDSVTSSAHFVGPLVYGLALASNGVTHWPFIAAFFLWGMASHAFGAVQDVLPDRKAHISSIATVIGARPTVWLSTLAYAVGMLLVALQGGLALLGALPFVVYVVNTGRFWRITDKTSAQANHGWKVFIYANYGVGFVVTMLLIVAALQS